MSIFYSDMLNDYEERCVFVEKKRVPDGYGTSKTVWTEGSEFIALFDFDSSTEAMIASQEGFTSSYRVYVPKEADLDYHEVFKRLSDGVYFRVTGDGTDDRTPSTSDLNMRLITAERWELPDA